jgi:predicted enzyme related to lactoylglutathione lyase
MSQRDGYEPGIPCWVASVHPDPQAAVGFYTRLFGWEARDAMPDDAPGTNFVCSLRDRDVAAISSARAEDEPAPAAWLTYVWVENVDETVAKATAAGGKLVAGPLDLLGAARIAILTDPVGAAFGVWEAHAHEGAQLVNEPSTWSISQLNTPDPNGAKDFYGAVFGWEADDIDLGGVEISLWRVPGYVGGEPEQPVSRDVIGVMGQASEQQFSGEVSPHWSIDFWVDDVDATAARAEELGGKVVAPPFDQPVGRSAVLADPQGATFTVSKNGPPA